MIFTITALLSHEQSMTWIEQHFHPQGLRCPSCGAAREQARPFRRTQRGLLTYRCNRCQSAYNLYNLSSGTIFAQSLLPPAKLVLLLRGVCKGESTAALAQEWQLSRTSVQEWRQKIQRNGYALRAQAVLPDSHSETDEMFQNAGDSLRRGR